MNILRQIYYSVGAKGRLAIRKAVYAPIDFFEGITGRRDSMTPKRGDIYVGSGDFKAQGKHLLQILVEQGGLRPSDSVLDIGSGIGRVAVALTSYLDPKSRYCGFDVVEKGVKWCKNHITKKYPNFEFKHVDLKNELYNQSTSAEACNFRFPYQDGEFNFAFLISVFTHMLPADIENYIKEIGRVLRPGGRCLSTFFIVDDEVMEQMRAKRAYFDFSKTYGDRNGDECLLLSDKVKEADVAFTYSLIERYAAQAGLKIVSYSRGQWTRLPETASAPDFQDVLVFEKP